MRSLALLFAAIRWPLAGVLARRRARLAEATRQRRIEAWQHAQLGARLAMHGDEYRRIVLDGESGLPRRTYEVPDLAELRRLGAEINRQERERAALHRRPETFL